MHNSLNQINIKIDEIDKNQDLQIKQIIILEKEQALLFKEVNILKKRFENLVNLYYNINNKDEENKYDYLEEKEINEDLMKIIKEDICLICLQNYNIQDKICYLPCTHFFHSSCIKKWLEMKNTCPLCKNIIDI